MTNKCEICDKTLGDSYMIRYYEGKELKYCLNCFNKKWKTNYDV